MQKKQLYTDQTYINLFPSFIPLDIAKMILSYTHLLQPPNLIKDIENYYTSGKELIEIYYNRWKHEPEEYMDWLSNDIIRFANQFQGTLIGFVPRMIEIWRRLFLFRDKDDIFIIDSIMRCISNEITSNRQIKFFWGLFTSKERDEILSYNNNSLL